MVLADLGGRAAHPPVDLGIRVGTDARGVEFGMVPFAIVDNEPQAQREFWVAGRLVAMVTREFLTLSTPEGRRAWAADQPNIERLIEAGRWVSNRILGDPQAVQRVKPLE